MIIWDNYTPTDWNVIVIKQTSLDENGGLKIGFTIYEIKYHTYPCSIFPSET